MLSCYIKPNILRWMAQVKAHAAIVSYVEPWLDTCLCEPPHTTALFSAMPPPLFYFLPFCPLFGSPSSLLCGILLSLMHGNVHWCAVGCVGLDATETNTACLKDPLRTGGDSQKKVSSFNSPQRRSVEKLWPCHFPCCYLSVDMLVTFQCHQVFCYNTKQMLSETTSCFSATEDYP